jgi:hypothetical protein
MTPSASRPHYRPVASTRFGLYPPPFSPLLFRAWHWERSCEDGSLPRCSPLTASARQVRTNRWLVKKIGTGTTLVREQHALSPAGRAKIYAPYSVKDDDEVSIGPARPAPRAVQQRPATASPLAGTGRTADTLDMKGIDARLKRGRPSSSVRAAPARPPCFCGGAQLPAGILTRALHTARAQADADFGAYSSAEWRVRRMVADGQHSLLEPPRVPGTHALRLTGALGRPGSSSSSSGLPGPDRAPGPPARPDAPATPEAAPPAQHLPLSALGSPRSRTSAGTRHSSASRLGHPPPPSPY